ncbi:MAG: cytochrome C biogenesis protein [Bacteroidetes bacterium]|nr:MAG: cytochrome C biogenesis protein [Bacteroidota bacterium]
MKFLRFGLLPIFLLALSGPLWSQTAAFNWEVGSKKMGEGVYEIHFKTTGSQPWQLFGPNQDISGVQSTTVELADSSIKIDNHFKSNGDAKTITSKLFDNAKFSVYEGPAEFILTIHLPDRVPAQLLGNFNYSYGKGDEFYTGTYSFSVGLEGGRSEQSRIRINSIDLNNPVSNCGDDGTQGKGLLSIFILGFVGGLIALITPCVFPLIPLTVSFFTKRDVGRKKGLFNAFFYGACIFLIYILLSLPFHLLDHLDPEILNNISTNVWLNLAFFVIFIVFAISFFGFFEITLPGIVANKADAKSGVGNLVGIFFMALTLAIVSFSCTGPILGSLLAGALSNNRGAIQLTFGMGGFGFGLALPFALFALFPRLLHSLPKSGGWLNSVKVVLGFLELAMAVKFLSNADLVKQWGLIKRETFFAIWVVIGILIILYLIGKIRFPHDSPVKVFSKTRITTIVLFAAITIYLIPGLTNTEWANRRLISGFPPPLCYSVYGDPVNCRKAVEPLRDYEEALALARKMNKPLLIDFTGWACVNCRRMEEKVWTDPVVSRMMKNDFVVVSLYVDERRTLPADQQTTFITRDSSHKQIITVGDKWATFQSENFNAVSQPQYAILSPGEKALTKTKGYTPKPGDFSRWLTCGLDAFKKSLK